MVFLLHFLSWKQSDLFLFFCLWMSDSSVTNTLKSRADLYCYWFNNWRKTSRMDSKHLFIFLSLWLILSCVMLHQAKSFQPRPRKGERKNGRAKNRHYITPNLKEELGSPLFRVCILICFCFKHFETIFNITSKGLSSFPPFAIL